MLELDLDPGEVKHECFVLVNRKSRPLPVTINAVDIEPGSTPDEVLRVVKHGPFGISTWLRFPVTTVVLQPGDDITVPYDIVVPSSPPVGTNHGGVSVTGAAPGGADSVAISTGLVMQVIVSIPGELTRDLRVIDNEAPSTAVHGRLVRYRFTVHNAGNVIDHVQGTLTLRSSISGVNVSKLKSENNRVLRQGKRHYDILWRDAPWIGRFQPTLTVRSDGRTQKIKLRPVWVLPPKKYLLAVAGSLLLPVLVLLLRWWHNRRGWKQYLDEDGEALDEDEEYSAEVDGDDGDGEYEAW